MRKTYEDYGIFIRPDKSGEQYIPCPQCSTQRKKKKVKCLAVNTEKEVWCCHHCGWSGGLDKGSTYADPNWNKPDYQKPKLIRQSELEDSTIDWFIKRGIYEQTLIDNKIIVDKVYMPQVEDWVKAIGFPFFRGEDHVNTKWRDNKKNFRQETGAEKVLYGLPHIEDSEEVIWVEGEMDKLSLYEVGVKNCVSVPDGAPSPEAKDYTSKFSFLESCEAELRDKKHILFLDSDVAGRLLQEELSRRLGKDNCRFIELPEGCKDANEYLVSYGPVALKELIETSKEYPVSGIHEAKSLTSSVLNLYKGGLQPGVGTGWKAVDYRFTVKPGQMTIVTGIPNHGKSNFLDCMLVNIAMKQGWNFGIFSPENQPLERHAAGLLEKRFKKAFKDIKKEDIEDGMEWLQEHFSWILPELDDNWGLDAILAMAKTLVYRRGIKCLVIDPWNEVEHMRPRDMSETEYISSALTTVRRFARTNDVHVFLVAHPAKIRKDKDGNTPVPTPYDISGSAHWRNKADNCIAVYRNFGVGMENITDIYIQKIRFKEIGSIGKSSLVYDNSDSTYCELSASNRK